MINVGERNKCELPKDEDIEDFLQRVEDVSNKINGLIKGTISVEELDKEEKKLWLEKRIKEIKEEEKKEYEKKRFLMGIEGKGNEDNYLFFCSFCFVLYNYDLTNCVRCNKKVISKEQRKKDINDKLQKYKILKNKRNIRRNRWNTYLKEQEKNKIKYKNSINYEKWNHYEPSSDSFDEDEKNLCLPRNNEQFKILETKLNQDLQKKKDRQQVAYSMKIKGNEYFKQKKYIHAIECYKNGLNLCKDYLDLYVNLALCQIKIYQYENAIINCNQVIQYYDTFKTDLKINLSIIFKGYARKALALFKLFQFKESSINFNLASQFNKNDQQVNEYINKCKHILNDQIKSNYGHNNVEYMSYGNPSHEKLKNSQKEKEEKNIQIVEKIKNVEHNNNDSKIYLPPNSNNQKNSLLSYNLKNPDINKKIMLQLSKKDMNKEPNLFNMYLKGIKKKIKKDEIAKLIFCSHTYDLENDNDSNNPNHSPKKRKYITMLSFFVDKINDILFDIKRKSQSYDSLFNTQNINNKIFKINKYVKKGIHLIIDILIFILENHFYYSDFCLNAITPIFTFYFLRNVKVSKCLHLLYSIISNNNEGKQIVCQMLQDKHIILKELFNRINNFILHERYTYTYEKIKIYENLKSHILTCTYVKKHLNVQEINELASQKLEIMKENEYKNMEQLEKCIKDNEKIKIGKNTINYKKMKKINNNDIKYDDSYILYGDEKRKEIIMNVLKDIMSIDVIKKGDENERISKKEKSKLSLCYNINNIEKELEMYKKNNIKNLYNEKNECLSLFGFLSYLIVFPNILNIIEKYCMKNMINIIIYINEKMYDYKNMECNYILFLLNFVSHIRVRSFILTCSMSNMFFYIEKNENDNIMKNILCVLYNLTITWLNEIDNNHFVLLYYGDIKESTFHKLIDSMESKDNYVCELSMILLSRFYLYMYCFNDKIKVQKNEKDNGNKQNDVIEQVPLIFNHDDIDIKHLYDKKIEKKKTNESLMNKLKEKIKKEYEKLYILDNISFLYLKRNIMKFLSIVNIQNDFLIINACIKLVYNLSIYTNFIFKNIYDLQNNDVNYFKQLISHISSILLDIKLDEKEKTDNKSVYVLINNIIMFFIQCLKFICIHNMNEDESIYIIKTIQTIIPYAIKISNSHEKKLNKNISMFLSYCFVNKDLKKTILEINNNDIRKVEYLLK
ncbi:TPR domain containing protein [Plasmodium sp. gorilla clade G2]|uniref:TPR domain containing protein n=1 Tax=Plasmodium sp. gorilla clade G2 TaxID=880535 RepID=UPI000D20E15C|nr:TPR domain containing protein [Plasmodium sp. gorilla clade G2]SOV10855.1 TPR domain containing protein [Plasmodium sp. gorilla clade G2]